MDARKYSETKQSNAVVDTLERLTEVASRERQAVGYPARCGKISYSHTVRELAMEAFQHGFSLDSIANAGGVQVQTIQKWFKNIQQSPFRELRIVASHELEGQQSHRELGGQDLLQRDLCQRLEFILPSGIRVLVSRNEFDEALLGIFLRAKGG